MSNNINTTWSAYLIEELKRSGVTKFVCSPGGRSAPLVSEVKKQSELQLTVCPDERGAGFFALGQAKASGEPAALISTSGTAVANFLPAVIEASQTYTPLIVLSADLPLESFDNGTSQSINQKNIFQDFIRWSIDFPEPKEDFDIGYLLSAVDQAVFRAKGGFAGPVQLNCRFEKPLLDSKPLAKALVKSPSVGRWEDSSEPFTSYEIPKLTLESEQLDRIASIVSQSKKGLLVVGSLPVWSDKAPIEKLIQKLNWPVIADISSGLQRSPVADLVITHADLILRNKPTISPDLVLHLGGECTQNSVNNLIRETEAKRILVNSHPTKQDPFSRVDIRLQSAAEDFSKNIADLVKSSGSLLTESLLEDNRRLSGSLSELIEKSNFSEVHAAKFISDNHSKDRLLFLGNSLPIRLFDSLSSNLSFSALSTNRGACGIDGQIATACGLASVKELPGTIVLGDQSTLHDLNSLIFCKQLKQNFIVVVFNNFGGAIFSSIPEIEESPDFDECFLAKHEKNFSSVAEFFELEYYKASSIEELENAYSSAQKGIKKTLIEVISKPESAKEFYLNISK